MRIHYALFLCLFFPIINGWSQAPTNEQILNFHSDITIHQDATIGVEESIKVYSKGQKIKRGIYREIPTHYKTQLGDFIYFEIDVLGVKKDGKKEPFHIDKTNQRIKIYVGEKNKFLTPGLYNYQIRYQVKHALTFLKAYDELYWNVTGNNWLFPIQKASATIRLPADSSVVQESVYTGVKGSTAKDAKVQVHGDLIHYVTTKPLSKREGLTVAVAWPKGFVKEPTTQEKWLRYIDDNIIAIYSLVFVLMLLTFYTVCWYRVGKDPKKGTIIPLYAPPKGLSPAAVHYVFYMGFRSAEKALTAALVNLGVKGLVSIESKKKDFTVRKENEESEGLGPGEKSLLSTLFKAKKSITFDRASHSIIYSAKSKFEKAIKSEYMQLYFRTNQLYFYVALGFTALYAIGLVLITKNVEAIFMLVWVLGWSIGVIVLTYHTVALFRKIKRGDLKTFVAPVFMAFFVLPFFLGEIAGITVLGQQIGWAAAAMIVLIAILHAVFFFWLKQPTVMGRKIMDDIEGFKLFLKVANKDEIEGFKGPDITPELFEAYLPYAIALDLENAWSERFESNLSKTDTQDASYHPSWYSGSQSFSTIGAAGLATAVGTSLASSIQTSSSSGSSGGGFSGGGGGGGGGGGW